MSRKYKIRDQDKLYFVTFTVIQWLDVFSSDSIEISFWIAYAIAKRIKAWKYAPIAL